MRIVILGKTGVGKSSLANTIFGENVFEIGHSANSETSECGSETGRVDGRDVTLIDTPGLFDTDRPEKELKDEILDCITECAPGPHAFLIVLNVARFTEQEQDVINTINQNFSEEAFRFATLLFTHGDQLKEGQTIEEYYRTNQRMSDLMKKCGGRCHVVDNKHWKNQQPDEYRSNQFQVKQLLKTIDHMIEANKGSYYTNKMMQAVGALIQAEEKEIRQSPGDMTEKEIRKKARGRVREMLLINLTTILAGALLGAFLGGFVGVGGVYEILKKLLSVEKVKIALAASAVEVIRGATVGVFGAVVEAEAAGREGALFGAESLGGAIVRGVTGYDGAKKEDTPGEAAKKKSESKPLIGPDS